MTATRRNVHHSFGGQCRSGDIAPYVLVPGSKDRVRRFSEQWDNARKVADHYEFLVYTGEYRGIPISACSTGIGAMSASIAIEELARLGGDTFLRVGVTGPMVDELEYGDIVIANGAVRHDGTSHDYVQAEYPALCHFEMVMACLAAVESLGYPYKYGVIADTASLGSETMDGFRHHLTRRTQPMIQEMYEAGVLGGTGEAATLMVQCSIYGMRCGVINVNSLDKKNHRWDPHAESKAIALGLETMWVVAEWDRVKEEQGLSFMIPELPAAQEAGAAGT